MNFAPRSLRAGAKSSIRRLKPRDFTIYIFFSRARWVFCLTYQRSQSDTSRSKFCEPTTRSLPISTTSCAFIAWRTCKSRPEGYEAHGLSARDHVTRQRVEGFGGPLFRGDLGNPIRGGSQYVGNHPRRLGVRSIPRTNRAASCPVAGL